MASEEKMQISGVDRIDGDHVLVELTDGSVATFSLDELLSLNPHLERRETPPSEED